MNDARARRAPADGSTGILPRARAQHDEPGHRGVDVFDLAPCGIVVVDERGAIVEANARALRDLGYERDELVGASIESLVPDECRAHHAAARTPFAPGPQHAMGRGRYLAARRKDGTTFPAEIALSRLADGRVAAFVVDITERRRAEEAVARMEAQLRVSDKLASLGILSAGMAHDINNPLSVILGNVAFLRDQMNDAEARDALDDLGQAAERIRAIVHDMRLFARDEEDGSAAPVDPCSVLASSLRMARYEIRSRAQVVCDLEPVPLVDGSDSRLGQVFVNLLLNAAQSIPEGDARRNEVRLRTRVGPGPSAIVEIADTGCGMTDDVREHLFEPLVATKAPGAGSGLGLSICQRIVTSMGGRIEVETGAGKGTLVRVILPASARAAAPTSRPDTAARPRASTTVLVVDDEPAVAEVVRRLLEPECRVVIAKGGADVLARVASGDRFDVILCDIVMPHVSGRDVYARLREEAPEQAERIVFLSGGASMREARDFLAQVENAVVEKPFTLADLTRAVTLAASR